MPNCFYTSEKTELLPARPFLNDATYVGMEGVLLGQLCKIEASSLSARFKVREIRHKLIWLCSYNLMLGTSMINWMENLKRMNHEEIYFWLRKL